MKALLNSIVFAILSTVSTGALASSTEPTHVSDHVSIEGESLDSFAARIGPEAFAKSNKISSEVCGEFSKDGDAYRISLYTTRELTHCGYQKVVGRDYTGLSFHTHIYIAEGNMSETRNKLSNPKFSDADYSHPGYLVSGINGRKVLFQNGRGTERRVKYQ